MERDRPPSAGYEAEPAWLMPTRLELLADDAGITPEQLRELLRERIEAARLRPSCTPVATRIEPNQTEPAGT